MSTKPSTVFRCNDIPALPDFPYSPHYAHYRGLRYAWIDETSGIFDVRQGVAMSQPHDPPAGESVATETILCLHGEPTWSYLYRKMIKSWLEDPPARRTTGPRYLRRRVVAPDLIGFGRSDKPVEDEYYTWQSHRDWLIEFVRQHVEQREGSTPVTRSALVVQDWGGILGLILPPLFPHLFTHLLVMNTALGLGKSPSPGWENFRKYMASTHDLAVGRMLSRGRKSMTKSEIDNYDLPFYGSGSHDGRAKAGVRRFPQLVPIRPSQAGVAESQSALHYYGSLQPEQLSDNTASASTQVRTPLQVFVCIGAADPVFPEKVMDDLSAQTWGKQLGCWRHVIPEGGHFVQEWAAHVPKLADLAWSSEARQRTVATQSEDGKTWEAHWMAPSAGQTSAKL